MNEHQQRLWKIMIELIQDYLDGKTKDFYDVVGKLEGALDASEIEDTVLINQWYELWTPLEIRRAVEGNTVNSIKAKEELMSMKKFLINNQEKSHF